MRQCSLLAAALVCVVATATGQQTGSPARGLLKYDDLFPADRVLEVEIKIDKRDWQKLRAQSRTIQMALNAARKRGTFEKPFSYFEADVTIDGVTFSKVGIRKKGFLGSLSMHRPSLKIKLNHGQSKASIGGLRKLTLNNNQQDGSLASQYLTYSLFNAAGVPSATIRPRSIIKARLQIASTSSRICVEMMIALVGAISAMSLRTANFWLGSSPSASIRGALGKTVTTNASMAPCAGKFSMQSGSLQSDRLRSSSKPG